MKSLLLIVSIQPKQENGLRGKDIEPWIGFSHGFNPAEAREWFKRKNGPILLQK